MTQENKQRLSYAIIAVLILALALLVWPLQLLNSKADSKKANVEQVKKIDSTKTSVNPPVKANPPVKLTPPAKNPAPTMSDDKKTIADLQLLVRKLAEKKVYLTVNPTPVIINGNKTVEETKSTVNQANLSASVSRVINNSAVIDKKEEYKKFCVRINGEHWPHKAINDGKSYYDAVDNGIGGFDIIVNQKVDQISGDYGVTRDNIVFVKISEIQPYGDNPQVIGPITYGSWKKMSVQGDYYIYKQ